MVGKSGIKKLLVSIVIIVMLLGTINLSACNMRDVIGPDDVVVGLQEGLDTALAESDGGIDSTVEYIEDEDEFVISIYVEDAQYAVDLVNSGNQEAVLQWSEFEVGIKSVNQTLKTLIGTFGYKDSSLVCNIYSDDNHDRALLTLVDGEITYSVVD